MGYIFALDLGGTNTKYAVMNTEGKIIEKGKQTTAKTLDGMLDFIKEKVEGYSACGFVGIAISAPGAITADGVINGFSAVPYIHGPNMKEIIEAKTNLPVHIENDANCAALAEMWQGSAKDKRDVAVVVIGTGVGGAIVKDGKIHKGANLHGGEFGYMIVHSYDSQKEFETMSDLASTASIIRRVAAARGVEVDTLSGEGIFLDAENGDPIAIKAIDEFYRMLAIGCYNIQYAYDPELILLGGGISARSEMIARLNEELAYVVANVDAAMITPLVHACHFLADANLIGAVYNFLQHEAGVE